jgi:hypothetical protein
MSLESLKALSTLKDKERISRYSGQTRSILDGIYSKPNTYKKLKLDEALPLIPLIVDIKVLESVYRLDRRVAVQHAIREHTLYRLFEHSLRCVKSCSAEFTSLEIGIKEGFCDEILFQWVREQGVERKSYWEILLHEGKCFAEAHIENALGNFGDSTVDLLHIDGFHSYESVKEDFNSIGFSIGIRLFVDEAYKAVFPSGLHLSSGKTVK